MKIRSLEEEGPGEREARLFVRVTTKIKTAMLERETVSSSDANIMKERVKSSQGSPNAHYKGQLSGVS